jgi:acyl-CoA reductase-like NAD-dependent aldehyde dehydrogenase
VVDSNVISAIFDVFEGSAPDASRVAVGLNALSHSLRKRRSQMVSAIATECGFSEGDAEEVADACLTILDRIAIRSHAPEPQQTAGERHIEIVRVPWGTIVVLPPQSAFLYLGVTCLANALAAGNRVVLRIPSGSRDSGAILAKALAEAEVVGVSLTVQGAKELLEAFYASPARGLVHYFGGSERIPRMLEESFSAGKSLLAEGSGNTWAYVDASADPETTVRALVEGATRYAGQTCTSVNGAVVHPALHAQLVEHLRELLGVALVENPDLDSPEVREGHVGPTLWVAAGDAVRFSQLWQSNRYPLCAAIFGENPDAEAWARRLGNVARLVINGDPSLEDPLEPWGGYPCTGNSTVAAWQEKYTRPVQIDTPGPGR